MKLTLITLSLFVLAVFFIFCKNTKYTADNLPKEQIHFGKGGGFTGIEKTYTLLENGQLFEKATDGTLTALESAKKKKAQGFFKTAKTLKLDQIKFQYPGNTYSFIEVPAGEGFNRISWGDNQHPVDGAVQDLLNNMMALVKTKQ